jgi:aromatic-L-amino-acid/L-tryptophan decarboxylase
MDDDDPANLELPADAMRALLGDTTARVIEHLAHVGEQRSPGNVDPDQARTFCRSMREPVPEDAADLGGLLDCYFAECLPRSLVTNGPGYMAYVPGGGIFPAALADLLSNTTNRFTGAWFASPALVQLEANVLDWFREWMGFPEGAAGVFTTGGSTATFNAIACAREKLLGAEIRNGVVYTSTQAHHSVKKSARLAGVAADRVRLLPVDALRLRVDALESAISADRAAGLQPFLAVSSAGTTNTGAVDPLAAIADVCARERLWHHVDGAYGAFFHAVPELRPLLDGLSRADSLTLDPHKGLFLPYGTGALLVRDARDLRRLHGASADYMPDAAPLEIYDPSAHGPDLSRGFPGLRVWLTIKMFGARRIRAAIAEKRALAVDAARRVADIPGITVFARPQLSLFAFRMDDDDTSTRLLLDTVNARGRVLLSGCTIEGRYLARVCVLSFRTRRKQIDDLVEDITAAAAALTTRR